MKQTKVIINNGHNLTIHEKINLKSYLMPSVKGSNLSRVIYVGFLINPFIRVKFCLQPNFNKYCK